jgi:signal transduction histidine kinase
MQRDELDTLNRNLERKVLEQTVEIRHALEAEKKARMELEKLNDAKDQFIMITQHHLRTPLTSVIWGLESVINNTSKAIGTEIKATIVGIKSSADRLMHIVDDFLNITAIKIGTSILNISSRSLRPAIEDILQELAGDVKRMNLTVSYPHNDADWPVLAIDYDKMREILFIVVDNAVRYNQEGGSLDISTKTPENLFELSVENTGIGITAEEKEKIGSALFYRGKYARKAYPVGMGIGLSVVKAIVRAHNGTFSIESKGVGKGAMVKIQIPFEHKVH